MNNKLVEDLREWWFSKPSFMRDTAESRQKWNDKFNEILSRYRPAVDTKEKI